MKIKNTREEVKQTNPEFYEEVASLNKEQLEHRIAQLAKDESDVEKSKEEDEKLQELRLAAKEASAPYRDAKKAIKLKIKLLLELLEERG